MGAAKVFRESESTPLHYWNCISSLGNLHYCEHHQIYHDRRLFIHRLARVTYCSPEYYLEILFQERLSSNEAKPVVLTEVQQESPPLGKNMKSAKSNTKKRGQFDFS